MMMPAPVIRVMSAVAIAAVTLVGATLAADAATATPPGAPTGVTTTTATATALTVVWSAPVSNGGAAIKTYAVEYRRVGDLDWTAVSRPASTATTLVVNGLTAASTYVFRVAAVNSAGTGPWNAQGSAIATGFTHSCVVMGDTTLRCWGENTTQQLGKIAGIGVGTSLPVAVEGITGTSDALRVVSVASGGDAYHSCAVMKNSTVRCWGLGYSGQLGDGKSLTRWQTMPVTGITGLTAATSALSVSVGGSESCSVMGTGAVLCWGLNANGQIGDGTTKLRRTPVTVSGITGLSADAKAMAVSVGEDHVCAVMVNATVRCWGRNEYGAIGDGTYTNRRTPVQVAEISGLAPGASAVSVASGVAHTCAVMFDGTVKCWGNNDDGQLGDGTMEQRNSPVAVSGITGLTPATTAVSVVAGASHTCAVIANGSILCWGDNAFGQMGNGKSTDLLVPTAVPLFTGGTAATRVVTASAGMGHTCVALGDGSLTCWGNNEYRQIGDKSTSDVRRTPMQVWGFTGATSSVRVIPPRAMGTTRAA